MTNLNIFSAIPKSFNIDIAGFCNLRCAYCPEGQKLNHQPLKFMSFQDFVIILNSLPQELTNIGLTNWSEPFLNKEIFKIIKYTKKNRPEIKIWVSSNGNAFRENMAVQTVQSGLDNLEITISGLTDEIYQKYHRNGKLNRVFRAIDEITGAKQKFNSLKPKLTINYLQFPYNIVDDEKIRQKISQELTNQEQLKFINAIRIVRGTMLGSQAILQEMKSRFPESNSLFKNTTHFKNLCLQPFLNAAIRGDGAVFPCCIIEYRDEMVMGNLHDNNFIDIWNSEKYKTFRKTFLTGENNVCNGCYFKYSPLPLFHKKYFKLRLKSNLKLTIQRYLKNIFKIDKYLFKSKFFQLWVLIRLKNKLRNS